MITPSFWRESIAREYLLVSENILKRLEEAVVNYDIESAVKIAKEVIATGFDPLKAIEQACMH